MIETQLETLRRRFAPPARPRRQPAVRTACARSWTSTSPAAGRRSTCRSAYPGSPFQRRVWDALRRIPYGETRTYAELAREIGAPGAARAVGAANGANRLAIVIPCHRVIAADGGLGGYGGGLWRKLRLLETEGVLLSHGTSPHADGLRWRPARRSRSATFPATLERRPRRRDRLAPRRIRAYHAQTLFVFLVHCILPAATPEETPDDRRAGSRRPWLGSRA